MIDYDRNFSKWTNFQKLWFKLYFMKFYMCLGNHDYGKCYKGNKFAKHQINYTNHSTGLVESNSEVPSPIATLSTKVYNDNNTDSYPIVKNFNWETDDWPKWYYNYEDKKNKNTLISPF